MNNAYERSLKPRPFIKWAGSKTKLLSKLDKYIPETFEDYYEPFLGGAALFFHLKHKRDSFRAFLSDLNEELINTFIIVRDHVDALIQLLEEHKKEHKEKDKDYYLFIRDEYEPKDVIHRAARTLFLNKTCYNGLYRVNKEGKFNVPYGRYTNPTICNRKTLLAASKALQKPEVEIFVSDYQDALKHAKRNDFVYLDPPYQPTNSTSNFTSYTHNGFSEEDQRRLKNTFLNLTERGCNVILSNSDTPLISRDLYPNFESKSISVARTISCIGNKRKGYTELIITNTFRC